MSLKILLKYTCEVVTNESVEIKMIMSQVVLRAQLTCFRPERGRPTPSSLVLCRDGLGRKFQKGGSKHGPRPCALVSGRTFVPKLNFDVERATKVKATNNVDEIRFQVLGTTPSRVKTLPTKLIDIHMPKPNFT